jgi:hypothetical protein
MCPNKECEHFGKPTGLMGGCDCGHALVPYKSLDEQVSDMLWEMSRPMLVSLYGEARVRQAESRRAALKATRR